MPVKHNWMCGRFVIEGLRVRAPSPAPCEGRTTASIPAFQAGDGGSIPLPRSMANLDAKKTATAERYRWSRYTPGQGATGESARRIRPQQTPNPALLHEANAHTFGGMNLVHISLSALGEWAEPPRAKRYPGPDNRPRGRP